MRESEVMGLDRELDLRHLASVARNDNLSFWIKVLVVNLMPSI